MRQPTRPAAWEPDPDLDGTFTEDKAEAGQDPDAPADE